MKIKSLTPITGDSSRCKIVFEDGTVLKTAVSVAADLALYTGKTLTEIKLDKTLTGITLSDGMKAVILDSVNSALKTPFAVTQSAHAQWNG